MKQIVFYVIVALVLIFVAGADAQVPEKPIDVYLGGGITVPTGTLSDVQNPGFHGYGRVGLSSLGVVNLVAGADFHQLPYDDGGVSGFDGGDARVLLVSGGLKYPITLPNSPVKPSMTFETGMAFYSVSDLTQPNDEVLEFESQSKLFLSFGVGVDINKFFATVRYIDVFTDGDDAMMIPFTVGVRF